MMSLFIKWVVGIRVITVLLLLLLTACSDNYIYEPWCPDNSNAIVYFNPSQMTINDFGIHTISIKVQNVDSLVSIYFDFIYDTSSIEITSIELDNSPQQIFKIEDGVEIIISDMYFADSSNVVEIGLLGRKEDFQGVSGEGNLVQVKFRKKRQNGMTIFSFRDIEMFSYPVSNPPFPVENISYMNALLFLGK